MTETVKVPTAHQILERSRVLLESSDKGLEVVRELLKDAALAGKVTEDLED